MEHYQYLIDAAPAVVFIIVAGAFMGLLYECCGPRALVEPGQQAVGRATIFICAIVVLGVTGAAQYAQYRASSQRKAWPAVPETRPPVDRGVADVESR